MKTLFIYLSINHGDSEEFEFPIDEKTYAQVKDAYCEASSKDGFENEKFWSNLKSAFPDTAEAIVKAINEELVHYIFEDDWIPDIDGEGCAENYFPLYDLHFDGLTADGDITMRGAPDCAKCIIYDDNVYDCDFSASFG